MNEHNFDDEQIEDFKEAFNYFDKDGSGNISIEELKLALKNWGISTDNKELEKLIKEIDKDGDGEIEWNEFLHLMKINTKESESELNLLESFKIFDTDCDGWLSKNDIKNVMKELNIKIDNSEINEIFKNLDFDNDSFINFEEFLKAFYTYGS